MLYFLDTNICIYLLNGRFPGIRLKLEDIPHNNIKIPAVVAAELYYGAVKSEKRAYNLARSSKFVALYDTIPFDHTASGIYAEIRAVLESKGQMIGGNDLLIAASALAYEAVLVTNNVKEFARIDELKIEDWTQEA